MLPELFSRTLRHKELSRRPPDLPVGRAERVLTNGPTKENPTVPLNDCTESTNCSSSKKIFLNDGDQVKVEPILSEEKVTLVKDKNTSLQTSTNHMPRLKAEQVFCDPLSANNANAAGDFQEKATEHLVTPSAMKREVDKNLQTSLLASISLDSINDTVGESFVPLPSTSCTMKSQSMHKISGNQFAHSSQTELRAQLPFFYFALFDGHAGADVAVAAANQLHQVRRA